MSDFIPNALAKLTTWIASQRDNRPKYGPLLGLTPDQVTARGAADTAMLALCNEADKALATAQGKVAERDAHLRDVYEPQVRAAIAQYKTNPAYTAAMGKEYDWVGTEEPTNPTTLQPGLRTAFSPEGIRLDWSKHGQDGVEVFRRPAGTTTWEKLAFDSRSPYIDTETGLQGPYEYYVQLMKADQPVGQRSDIVTAMHG